VRLKAASTENSSPYAPFPCVSTDVYRLLIHRINANRQKPPSQNGTDSLLGSPMPLQHRITPNRRFQPVRLFPKTYSTTRRTGRTRPHRLNYLVKMLKQRAVGSRYTTKFYKPALSPTDKVLKPRLKSQNNQLY